MANGIVCNDLAGKYAHESAAAPGVQARRAVKRLPNGRRLHSYANLFFHARNSMMSVIRNQNERLCILRLRTNVLDLKDVTVSDRNAAASIARFYEAEAGIEALDRELVFARSWDAADPIEKERRKQIRSAEVLVPDRVPAEYISGAYVSCNASRVRLTALAPDLAITIQPDMFFR